MLQVGKMHFGYILGWMVVGSGLLWWVQLPLWPPVPVTMPLLPVAALWLSLVLVAAAAHADADA